MEEKRTSVTGRFYRRIYEGERGYCIDLCSGTSELPSGVIRKSGNRNVMISVSGYGLPDWERVNVRYNGTWSRDNRGRYLFRADSYELITPDTKIGMINFLSSDMFPGIGKKLAERLYNFCDKQGMNILDTIEREPHVLLAVRGFTQKKLDILRDSYDRAKTYSRIAEFLGRYEIPSEIAIKVNEHDWSRKYGIGVSAIDILKEDPYCILDVKGVGFRTADRLGRGMNRCLDSGSRIAGAVAEALKNDSVTHGNMYSDYNDIKDDVLKVLNEGFSVPVVTPEAYEQHLSGYRPERFVVRPGNRLFLRALDDAESCAAAKLAHMIRSPVKRKDEIIRETERYCLSAEIRLSEKQKHAVMTSLSERVSVITGGPGTGKTTVIKAIISVYETVFSGPVTCMAPTGKAARRMAEASGREAMTIHSRLRLFTEHYYDHPLSVDDGLVIVDEASMIDGMLMKALMKAVDENCQLILVGDVNQLPSIGAGAVLSELIDSGVIAVTRLTDIFRQKGGSTIIENAMKINSGDPDLIYDENFVFTQAGSEEDAVEKIKNLYTEECQRWGIDEVALLSPLRRAQGKHVCCSEALNPVLQEEVNPQKEDMPYARFHGTEFRMGDRVLQWKNGETSSNGDVGEIVRIWDDEEEYGLSVEIRWDNGNTVTAHKEDLESIELAYSLSVHKSQGSEYECVIIPILSCQSGPLMKRNLLYTGVTRAKKKCIIVGDKRAIANCIAVSDNGKRATLLAERLRYNCRK